MVKGLLPTPPSSRARLAMATCPSHSERCRVLCLALMSLDPQTLSCDELLALIANISFHLAAKTNHCVRHLRWMTWNFLRKKDSDKIYCHSQALPELNLLLTPGKDCEIRPSLAKNEKSKVYREQTHVPSKERKSPERNMKTEFI